MAKFAKVGYGSHGQGLGATSDGYTYIVNDNVRTGDRIQVISTSSRGRKFATTGVPLHTYKENTKKGQEAKQEVTQKLGVEPTQSYSGKELGVTQKGLTRQSYQQEVRGAALSQYKQENPNAELSKNAQETFDSYSKKYMK